MANKKKTAKISFKEYLALKKKAAGKKFRLHLYPLPVLTALLLPLAVFIIMLCYYYLSVKNFSD